MAVSNYLAKSEYGCRYHYDKLKDVIYLVSESHLKFINIDNGEANISGLTESPLEITGFNIEFKEETSLDERYKFQKSLTISVNGYSTFEDLNEKYYAIIVAKDNTYYMVNVDFPSKVTHTYHLSKDTNRTDFTLSSVSNFPALKLNGFNPDNATSCKNYAISGVDGLKMLESAKTELKESENKVVATEEFKLIEYLGETLSFQEVYDGDKFTTTLEFQIAFDAYKTSWHYNILEFIMNRYAAIIGIKNSSNKIYTGFKEGLQPNYSIESSNGKDKSDIVTITLIETANKGLTIGNFEIEINSAKHWRYVSQVGNKKSYECVDRGVAKYLLQEESDYFGNPTGNYKVLSGYAVLFNELNIIGTFDDEVLFYSPECVYNGPILSRWVNLPIADEYMCYGCPEPNYRWVVNAGGYECSGTTKMTQEKKQESYDSGSTWIDVYPLETRIGSTVIQYNSSDCGYVPPTPVFTGKWKETVYWEKTGSIYEVHSAACNSSSAITINEVPRIMGEDRTAEIEIGKCVKKINNYAFENYYSLTSCTIGNNVETIGKDAFGYCSGLTNIVIPDSVTTIGNGAFNRCRGITNVIIGDGVRLIDTTAFYGCESLTSVTIGSGCITIGDGAFGGCANLPNIVIPNNVVEIERGAFGDYPGSYNLTGVTIGSGATSISDSAFNGARYVIRDVNLNMPNIGRCFSGCTSITAVTLGDSVTTIEYSSFMNCASLTGITIPDNVTSIGIDAFNNCSGLTRIIVEATIPPTIGNRAFYNTNNCPIFVPCESIDIYKSASGWSNYASRITCTEYANILAILELNNGNVVEYLNIENNINATLGKIYSDTCINAEITTACTSIGRDVFNGCITLTSCTLPNTITTIGNGAFNRCTNLPNITIPDSITSIGTDAFNGCNSLTSITIPDSVTSIGKYAFYICRSLSNITIGNSVTSIGEAAFAGCSGITSITIPDSVTSIGKAAFSMCESLTSITVDATTPPTLGSMAFDNTNNCPIYVPSGSVNVYKTANKWSDYADRIRAIQ